MPRFEDVIRNLNGGQQEALLRKLFLAAGGENSGEEGLQAILRDELTITLADAMIKLVDRNGRCIPLKSMKSGSDYVKANRNYWLVQPDVNAFAILSRLQQFFPGGIFVSSEESIRRAAELLEQLQAMKQMKNLLRGVSFPICLPKMDVDDYGKALEQIFLDAVKRSYEHNFPGRKFQNCCAGTLSGQVGIVDESRHGQLIEKMRSGPVVGFYFPNPMQGFSISADRKLIQVCPEGFLLTSAIDTAVAMVAKPDVLARSYNTPVLDCAANTWRSAGRSLCFCPKDDKLGFNSRHTEACNTFSGGLLFVG